MGVTMTTVTTSDGRQLEVMHGDLADQRVVVSHGGTPQGLADWPWMTELADGAGLGIVTINRPGYGASTPRSGRTVSAAAEDTRAVLDHLGVDEFVSLGVSGGGPHALADGGLLGGRCVGVVDVAGLAPPDLDRLEFTDGMGDQNKATFEAATTGGAEGLAPVAELYEALMGSVTADVMIEMAPTMLPPVDAAALAGPNGSGFAEFFAAMSRAAFTSGSAGLVDDLVAFTRPWGFDLADVRVPVIIWHGELDENVPVGHSRAIEAAVPNATARYRPEHGHLSILLELPSIIDDVAALAR